MSSVMRFDEWQDSNGVPVLDGTDLSIPSSALPAGSVLQVVSTTKSDTFTTSSASFSDVTGLSVTITPTSTSSKIFVSATVNVGHPSASAVSWRLTRGGSAIAVGDAAGSRTSVSSESYDGPDYASFTGASTLDSPNTVSATTYTVQLRANSASAVYVNRSSNDSNSAFASRLASTITVMEVAG
jgi:hypothetical protein